MVGHPELCLPAELAGRIRVPAPTELVRRAEFVALAARARKARRTGRARWPRLYRGTKRGPNDAVTALASSS